MFHFLPWKLVSRILAALLLASALLKANGLGFEAVSSRGIFSAPEFQIALVELEIVLGIWLLWGKNPVGAWIVSLLVFAGFAGASFYLGWIGQASCGCFGKLTVNPWITLGFDVVALGLLVAGRPDLKMENSGLVRSALPAAYIFGGVLGFLGLLVGFSYAVFGSTDSALAYFRGERVSVRPRLVDIGKGVPGESRTEKVEVLNRTNLPIRIIGGTSDCSCIITHDLPITVPAGEFRIISVVVRFPRATGIFTRKVVLLTDDEQIRAIAFRLTAVIAKPESPSLAQAN